MRNAGLEETQAGIKIAVVQWLRLHAFIVEGAGLIPDWGNKIPQATQQAPNK